MNPFLLNERIARDLIGRRFPELRVERVRRIDEGGARAYEVNGEFIFRFATDEADSAKLEREVAVLAELAPELPIAVPDYEFADAPGHDYPCPFAGYRKIAGLTGEEQRPSRERWPAIAAQFGEFLSALHGFPVERARALGVPKAPEETFGAEYRTKDAATLLARVRGFAGAIRTGAPDLITDETERYLSGRVALPPRSPLLLVLCHADLKGEHILVSERADAVVGVVDWTDCTITDPLLDFARLLIWLGEGFARQVLTRYTEPVDGAFLERACFYARCFALDNLGWQLTNRFYAPLELLKTQARWAFAQ